MEKQHDRINARNLQKSKKKKWKNSKIERICENLEDFGVALVPAGVASNGVAR
jgi:hypothetical protein